MLAIWPLVEQNGLMDISSAPPIRVGLIGYGFSGKTFHAPLIRAVPGLTLCLIGSSDAAKVQADLPDMATDGDPFAVATSPEVDLVVIATPNDSHAPLARAALMAGKHVVVDKPFTVTLADARDLHALATRCDRVLSVFHNRRWDSDFVTVRQAIADGVVGTVRHFESTIDRFRPQVRDRWRERSGPGSGLWFDLGPHLIDQALQLFGLPDRITAHLAALRVDARTDDWAHVVLDYPGHRAVLHASVIAASPAPRFIVHGDTGTMVKQHIDRQERQLIGGMIPGADGWGEDPDPLVITDAGGHQRAIPAHHGDQRAFYAKLAKAIRAPAAPNPVSPIQAIVVMACIDACFRSAETHSSVGLPIDVEERSRWDDSLR